MHGDILDRLCQRSAEAGTEVLLHLALEMGSWPWVKKNPRQSLDRRRIFNPRVAHRQQRVLRRHLPWFDFLTRAAVIHVAWIPAVEARDRHREAAPDRWSAVE